MMTTFNSGSNSWKSCNFGYAMGERLPLLERRRARGLVWRRQVRFGVAAAAKVAEGVGAVGCNLAEGI
jgi:hypothetical protein